ncbi:unnamed protein product, partial [Fusarium langsethiae]
MPGVGEAIVKWRRGLSQIQLIGVDRWLLG